MFDHPVVKCAEPETIKTHLDISLGLDFCRNGNDRRLAYTNMKSMSVTLLYQNGKERSKVGLNEQRRRG